LLVWQQQYEQKNSVVPIDVKVRPPVRVVAITGPNTGGKTVTLKTLGLAALMAKVGLFIPANDPVKLPWFEQILADIGDEQSLEQSLSTFSGHIRRIIRILEAIDVSKANIISQKLKVKTQNLKVIDSDDFSENENNSEIDNLSGNENLESSNLSSTLVLLDEVGAGTDPTEGSALAISLLQYLADNALLTVATTHFGELKALKYEDERFENASVEFDSNSLQPTYRLLWGIPGRSNAMTIAGRLGLKQDIIDRAQDYVGDSSEDVNKVIAGLEEQRQKQETKAKEASALLQETEYLHQEVARKASALKERERELKLAQEVAVQEKIAEAKAEIARVIRNLQQGPLTARNAQKATNAINEISEKYLPSATPPPKKPGFMPKEGDRIRIPKIGQIA
ncbi:MAG: endonuclease MutS2, partial [Trichodesmium sp. St16_bin4-tuft]|nr:endonuclease MutS2 [Trichodesmium sp. St16_bin4-tuft]